MNKAALLEQLQALSAQEDALAVAREVAELRTQMEDLCLEEDRKFQVSQLEAQEKGEEVPEKQADEVRTAFYDLLSEYREKRTAQQRVKQEAEEANLRRKKALIARLKEVVEKEENIGAALTAYKEIHEQWKEVGDIPRDKRQEVQSEYSRLLETFFYHIKIYRELREHDLHRNEQLKLDVIKRIQALASVEQIKEIEHALKGLQNEWDEIGPVRNEEWEKMKDAYWEAVRALYQRIHGFYEERRGELTANLERKKELAEQAATFVTELAASSAKDWDAATKKLLELQEAWKQIGFGPRKENEEVWKSFRGSCDEFFGKKKTYFESLKGDFDKVANKKQELIDKLNELKDSQSWKETTAEIVKLQQVWKSLGNAGQRNEQKLWKEFRGACDHFFNAKQAFYAQQDEALAGNLVAKQELIEKIKNTPLSEDKKEALAVLRAYAAEFSALGKVPMKDKDTIYNGYRDALDSHYKKLKLEGEEQDRVMFQAKLDTLKASPNADKVLQRERIEIREKITRIETDIRQLENNLGFFAKSKGADTLRKEVEGKIDASRKRIAELKNKLKQLVQE
jgi:hypothetical protein